MIKYIICFKNEKNELNDKNIILKICFNLFLGYYRFS